MVIEENFLNMLYEKQLVKKEYKTFTPNTALDTSFEMLISIGGDGTILRAASLVRNSGVPILGINAGRLGFLATVPRESIDNFLQYIIDKNYTISERTLLSLTCDPKNEAIEDDLNFAMNEVTVSRKDTTSMITVETYLNNEYLNSYWADGLIIATPTGSTGYNMSCNGPILFPDSSSFVITPVAPHNLNVRSVVVPDSSVISFEIEGRTEELICALDARKEIVPKNIQLAIKKESFSVNFIRLNENSYLTTLRTKLTWGLDKRN